MMTSSSIATPLVSKSSLYIPHEMLGKILSHCDASTLAVVSRVSSVCLELASPFLYEDVVITEARSIPKLFRLKLPNEVVLATSDRVSPYTSLSLIRSLTFVSESVADLTFLDDYVAPPPLALSVLLVSVPTPGMSNVSSLLLLVDPKTVILRRGRPSPTQIGGLSRFELVADHAELWIIPLGLARPPWTRLDTIVFHGIGQAYMLLRTILFETLANPDRLVVEPPRVIIDLGNIAGEGPLLSSGPFSSAACTEIYRLALLKTFVPRGALDLRVWIRSQAQSKELEEKATSWGHPPQSIVGDVLDHRALALREDLISGSRSARDWETLIEMASSESAEDPTSSA